MATPDSAAARKQIVEIIGDGVLQALGLMETLQDERKALEDQDMDALKSAVDSKGKCVDALRTMEDKRRSLCIAAGFPDGPDQMVQMLEWCDEGSVIASCWQHLMDVATECNTLNMTNGAIIRGRKQQIETSISIIRGGQPEMDTYNRSGREPQGHHLRSIAEA
jgi:flagellar biosynthesis/type III secretory pathway chaperone